MKDKGLENQLVTSGENEVTHPEVRALLARLTELEPKDLAMALYHLETIKEVPYLSFHRPQFNSKMETQIYFSRGLKKEIEEIYLDLARHLKSRSKGSQDLMNAVFDFLGKTLTSMIEVPYLVSMN